jgi:cAMP-dependent protein kinase regulator
MSITEEDIENVTYINTKLNPLLEKLVTDILKSKPNDIIDFMIDWLLGIKKSSPSKRDTSPNTRLNNKDSPPMVNAKLVTSTPVPQVQERSKEKTISPSKKTGLISILPPSTNKIFGKPKNSLPLIKNGNVNSEQIPLGKQSASLINEKGKKTPMKSKESPPETPAKSSETEESEDDEDTVEDIPIAKLQQRKNQRSSVSAEAYGAWNKKQTYIPKIVEKSSDQKTRISARLNRSFLFNSLEDTELEIVINAMEEKKYTKDDVVIKEGDFGDALYVIDSGTLNCTKIINNQIKQLKIYQPAESFGELALLYGVPRAATIIALEDCVLFSLDRECFTSIVKDAAMHQRERYEEFLSKVPILQSMDNYEKSQLCDALKSEKHQSGDYIIKQGDTGDRFYILEEGSCVATKRNAQGTEEEVFKYSPGDYFGELALLKQCMRQANIVATSNVSVLGLERESFSRILGPLEDILKRNMDKYNQYVKS